MGADVNIKENIISNADLEKLKEIGNRHVEEIIETFINQCRPSKVIVLDDSREDINYTRELAKKNGEEMKLSMEGHTVHYDAYRDQARDKGNTCVLVTPEMKLSNVINTKDRDEGLMEISRIMNGIMEGKTALVRFFCLGPTDSKFTIPALQITDSAYVAHSEDMLYRPGYEQFKKLDGSGEFFHFIHSAGRLDERGNSLDINKRRIYIDIINNRVLTVNNQYAGNSVGLKKLALRLAIYKSNHEDWLTEHMFIMGVQPEGKNRKTYFTGAFPSACGKTSTAMIPGQSIVGDDIAYIRISDDGKAYAVNIEDGIFGIIEDVNPVDDPVIYETLTTPRELIFSNVLVNNGEPYWLGMGKDLPEEGINHFGKWRLGDKDDKGNEIGHAHKNARYTIRLKDLENVDPKVDDPDGVPVDAIIYGGRDSDTLVPVYQSLNWLHGVFIGASLESESTAATLGKTGVRNFSPMANMDFLVVPLEKYIDNHIKFGERLKESPLIFATNYFLKNDEKFLNGKVDKKIWLLWMEGRVHKEYDAIETPIGFIPIYDDLKNLFKQVFGKSYTLEDYNKQFSIRINKYLEKMDRIKKIYEKEDNISETFRIIIKETNWRLLLAKDKFGKNIILPEEFNE